MGTVTAYNLANVQAALGGANPISMSEYYRGGAYVPANRTIAYTAREPATGENYNMGYFGQSKYHWFETSQNILGFYWNNTYVYEGAAGPASITSGGITYYRGSFVTSGTNPDNGVTVNFYAIYRTYPSSYQQAINTGVPSSGAISLSQLYGAANP
jgi:hypothetical protein